MAATPEQRRADYAADKNGVRTKHLQRSKVKYADNEEYREAQKARSAASAAARPDVYAQRWQRERDRPDVHEAKLSEQARVRLEVLLGYGGRCKCCGTDYLPHLTIDHVNGNGGEERRQLGRGSRLIRKLRREGFPEGYQVLCWNCNWAKHTLGACGCSEEVTPAQEPCAGGVVPPWLQP